ncbi:hypothetical protein Z962_p0022 (plasmid) [Clostridium botulinum C/D str. BKT12695]|nr:hypothetical protein Z962_p0022 [Clostridium botulinum C/D str. BKT12695]
MSERKQEVNFAVNLIQKLCEEANIALIATERQGVKLVVVHDNVEDQDYVILRK